jgi:hypothetical protein
VCANFCIAQVVSDIKLEECDGCQSVLAIAVIYVKKIIGSSTRRSVKELQPNYNRNLFEQPEESHLGECPICFFPLSLDIDFAMLLQNTL